MRLSDVLAAAIADYVDRCIARRTRRTGTVAGTSGTRVVVTVRGASMIIPRLASYAPTVGDTVLIDTTGDGWVVLGKTA